MDDIEALAARAKAAEAERDAALAREAGMRDDVERNAAIAVEAIRRVSHLLTVLEAVEDEFRERGEPLAAEIVRNAALATPAPNLAANQEAGK